MLHREGEQRDAVDQSAEIRKLRSEIGHLRSEIENLRSALSVQGGSARLLCIYRGSWFKCGLPCGR